MGRTATPSRTPIRQCRVCRQRAAKQELERWVVGPDGLLLDTHQNHPGRGWYACRTSRCSRFIAQVAQGQIKKIQKSRQAKGAIS